MSRPARFPAADSHAALPHEQDATVLFADEKDILRTWQPPGQPELESYDLLFADEEPSARRFRRHPFTFLILRRELTVTEWGRHALRGERSVSVLGVMLVVAAAFAATLLLRLPSDRASTASASAGRLDSRAAVPVALPHLPKATIESKSPQIPQSRATTGSMAPSEPAPAPARRLSGLEAVLPNESLSAEDVAKLPAVPPPPAINPQSTPRLPDVGPLELPETPAPRPVPVAVDDATAIRTTLAQYERAYSKLDAAAVGVVWPAVDRDALARAFRGLATQDVRLEQCALAVAAGSASVTCDGTLTWSARIGGGSKPRQQRRTWNFVLEHRSESWKIVKVDLR